MPFCVSPQINTMSHLNQYNATTWFAVYVRSRQERPVSHRFRDLSYEEFVPWRKVRRKWSDRIKSIEEPLFPGYVFCKFDPACRLSIVQTPGVVSIVGNGRELLVVPDQEIDCIRTIVNSGYAIEHLDWIRTGEAVEICGGPLTGVRGLLIRNKGADRLVVSVGALRRSVAVEVDRSVVRPVRLDSKVFRAARDAAVI